MLRSEKHTVTVVQGLVIRFLKKASFTRWLPSMLRSAKRIDIETVVQRLLIRS